MNWGARIVLAFVVFGIIIISMVVIAMRQDINLVAEDYYQQEIEYEDQIERLKNTNQLTKVPSVSYIENISSLEIVFPDNHTPESGTLTFFRPSNADLDQEVVLELDSNGRQLIPIKTPMKGYWKAQLLWTAQEKEYFKEEVIIL